MIFLTGYFEVCLSEIKERSLNSWFLTVFFFLYPYGTNKICKTCSVTQIRGGRMRIGRDGSWQQATTGFEQKSDCCSGTKWLIRQKEIGSEKARNAILLWQQLLDCQFPEEHKPTKSNLDFGIIPKERNLVEFHLILCGFHWPKKLSVCLFFNYILDRQADPNLLGDTSSLTLTGHRAKLQLLSLVLVRQLWGVLRGMRVIRRWLFNQPLSFIVINVRYYLWTRAIRKFVLWQRHVPTSHVSLQWNSPAVVQWLIIMDCNSSLSIMKYQGIENVQTM